MGWPIKTPSTIYAIRCKENGKLYIGRTQNLERRMREHLYELRNGSKRRRGEHGREDTDFQKDFTRYGESGFEVYVLEESVSPSDVCEREAAWIEEYRSAECQYGYNIDDGRSVGGFSIKQGLPPKRGITDKQCQISS